MDRDLNKAEFKKSFRGYNTAEVDEFLLATEKDIDSLKGEIADLYRKLEAADAEIERYRREEAVRGDIIKKAKEDSDQIVNEAKSLSLIHI